MTILNKLIIKLKLACVLVTCVSMLVISSSTFAARFFRYVDENGKLVLSHTIPNDRVMYGYEIVDEGARVIQKVGAQLTEVQYQRKQAEEARLKECNAALNRVRSLYQFLSEIDYAEKQALQSVDVQIANTKANLANTVNQRKRLEAQAAQQDISGKRLSNSLLDNIESAKTQEINLEEQIEARYAEKLELREGYRRDREVFRLESCRTEPPPPSLVE